MILDTYHFLILIFEAAYYEIHRLLIYRLLSGLGGRFLLGLQLDVLLVRLVDRAL